MSTSTATTLPFTLGEPTSFGGLGLVPLYAESESELEYIGLDEARRSDGAWASIGRKLDRLDSRAEVYAGLSRRPCRRTSSSVCGRGSRAPSGRPRPRSGSAARRNSTPGESAVPSFAS